MKAGNKGKLLAVFIMVAAGLVLGHGDVQTAQQCRDGMVFVPGGAFYAGITDEEFDYVLHLCDISIGGCYESWFQHELPRRRVSYKPFCLDKYEYPNQAGRYPMTGVSYDHAEKLCKRQGKRLCEREEWEAACEMGDRENVWVYGHMYRHGVCNDYTQGLLPSGYMRDCVNSAGAFDLTGNVAEWVEGKVMSTTGGMVEEYNVLKGGSYRQRPVFSRCTTVDYRNPDNDALDFGFRCCDETLTERNRRGNR